MRNRRSGKIGLYESGQIRAGMNAPQASIPHVAVQTDPAWSRLARAAVDSGLIINNALARDYAREQTARVDDAVLEASKRYELWKADFNAKNRGKQGVNALQEYQDNFARIADEVIKDFDGARNEIFEDLLKRRLAERGLSAIREGASFASVQEQQWLNSQWQAQIADFQAYVAANPDDAAGIAFRKNNLLASWSAKNPGLDPGKAAADLNGLEFKERMEGFLASGDVSGAKAFMSNYSALAGLRIEDSNHKWLLAHNNPGSVTVDGKNFAAYATRKDGLKAVMGCLASYHKNGRKTIARMISRYAPPNENDTQAYIAFVARKTGLDPNKEIDIRDPRILAGITGAILSQEHSVQAEPDELMEAAQDFLQNGRPKAIGVIKARRSERSYLPGFDPASLQNYAKRIEALEKGQLAESDLDKAQAILSEVQKLPIERRDAEILRIIQELPREEAERLRPLLKRGVEERKQLDHLAISFQLRDAFLASMRKMPSASEEALTALAMNMFQNIEDPKLREELKDFAFQEIKNRNQARAARDALDVQRFLEGQKGRSPAQIQAALAASGLSEQAKARAAQLSFGLAKEENPANLQATSLALMLKDSGALESETEIQAFAKDNALTIGQVKQIRDYKGKAAQVSISRINNLLKNLASMDEDFQGPDQIDAQAYNIILERLKPGQEPTDLDLIKLLSNLYLHNGGAFLGFGKTNVMDELAKEQFNMEWLPEVPNYQRLELEKELKARGLKPSVSNTKKLLKLKLFQNQGWPIENIEWEK